MKNNSKIAAFVTALLTMIIIITPRGAFADDGMKYVNLEKGKTYAVTSAEGSSSCSFIGKGKIGYVDYTDTGEVNNKGAFAVEKSGKRRYFGKEAAITVLDGDITLECGEDVSIEEREPVINIADGIYKSYLLTNKTAVSQSFEFVTCEDGSDVYKHKSYADYVIYDRCL